MPRSTDTIKLFIVDDHQVVRQGTRDMLCRHERLDVTGEAPSGENLAEQLASAHPDILLLDVHLPGANGFELLKTLKPDFPNLKIILFSASAERPYLEKAQSLGADGYLSKTISEADLQQAMITAFDQGIAVYSEDVSQALEAPTDHKLSSLTPRELDIFKLVASGKTNQQIADELVIAVKTVDTHVANLLKKMQVAKRSQLIAYAFEHKLVI